MLVKFNKSGKVALNYGIDGIIEVEADEVRELERGHALTLIDHGIAVQAEPIAKTKKVLNGAKVADSFMPDVEPKEEPSPEPKKRGRKPKAK